MNRIKILEMIDQPFLGGGQINVLTLARGLAAERFDVTVCTRREGPLVDELNRSGLKCLDIPFRKALRLSLLGQIEDLLRGQAFDILHTHGGVAGLYGRWAAGRVGRPKCIHTLHGIHYLHYRNPLLKHLHIAQERWLGRKTEALILVSSADLRAAAEHRLAPPDRRVLIRNGIDFPAVRDGRDTRRDRSEVAAEWGLDPGAPLIGTVSRLHRQKGLPHTIRAIRRLVDLRPSLRLMIVGGGPERESLRRLIRELGLESHTLLLGEREDVPRLVSAWDVFLLASLWEGLPYALLEAAALEKPVVASDIDGIREIVEDGLTGRLVPAADAAELAGAVHALLDDPERAAELGRRLGERTRMVYSEETMLKETENLYLKVVGSGGRE